MQQNGYNNGSRNYSNPELERDLQRLEAEHQLYELFDNFLSDYNDAEIDTENKVIYLEEDSSDRIVNDFIEEYGEDFLDINPEITEEDKEFYRSQPDDLYNEVVHEMVEEYISEGNYFEADFQNNTQKAQNANSGGSVLRGAAKAALVGSLVVSGISGMATAETSSGSIPIEMDEEMSEYADNSAHRDTDDDGLPDFYEEKVLSNADPEQRDIFVEVDYSSNCDVDKNFFEELEEVYADAPIENPDGSEGINLHMIVDDELDLNESVDFNEQNGSMNDRPEIMAEHFDSDGYGTHYMLLVDNATNGKDVLGTATSGSMVVECGDRTQGETLRTSSHELAHSLGLSSNHFEGVDSREIPFEEYPSAMNYNSQDREPSVLDYSDGTNSDRDFDDWSHLEKNQHTPEIHLDSDE